MTADEIIAKLNALTPKANDLLIVVEKQTNERLAMSIEVGGKAMKPLKKKTIDFKAKKGQPSKPWFGTGKLVNSFRYMKSGNNVIVTNSQDYFDFMEYGTEYIDPRPVVGVDENTIPMLEDIVKQRRR